MTTYPYVWTWRHRDLGSIHPAWKGIKAPWFGDGIDRAGQRCRVVCRDGSGRGDDALGVFSDDNRHGGMNSAWLEFEDGFQTITSRGGLRRAS